jgi:2-methylcitrate dehydratase PrpD
MTVAQQLAEYVAGTSYEALPAAAVRAAKASLIDTLAVSLAARGAPGVSEVIAIAVTNGGRPASSLWTCNERVPPSAAAFTNGFLASALDFDSLHQKGVAHADIVIVPAAVAVAEDVSASGKALVTAIAAGDDVLCRLCLSTRRNTGWFYSSLYGPIAAAAITASLLGAGARAIEAAMGIGSMSAAGTQQPAVERSMGKRMQCALAAGAGVAAGYLAARGLDGPREFVEGKFGLHAMCEKGDAESITRDLGVRFENAGIGYKLYPSCQCNHAAIEGMLRLRERSGISQRSVAEIEVTVSPYMHRLVGAPYDPGANPQVAAQFSVQYSIAAVLVHGSLGVKEISSVAASDPMVGDLARRVRVVVDPHNHNNYTPITLKITRTDGSVCEEQVVDFRGSEALPLTDNDLREKLAMCIEAAGGLPGAAKIDTLFDAVMNIEEARDVRAFASNYIGCCLA